MRSMRSPNRALTRARLSAILALTAALAGTVLAGCDELPFTPSSLIDKPRIAAIAAEPPVVALDGAATLTALVVSPDGRDSSVAPDRALDLEIRWRVCNPWKPVFEPDRDCANENALELAAMDGDTWQGQAQVAMADVLEAFPVPPDIIDQIGGMPGGMPPGMEDPDDCPHSYDYVELPVVAEVTVGESRLLAIQRVRVTWEPVDRKPLVVGGLVLDDEVTAVDQIVSFTPGAGQRLTVSMDRGSLDSVCLDDDPEQIAPEPVAVLAYVTAGELDEPEADIEYAEDGTESAGTMTWTAPASGNVTAWLVVTDTDGGATWARFSLEPQ
jgi:hypothetical protein